MKYVTLIEREKKGGVSDQNVTQCDREGKRQIWRYSSIPKRTCQNGLGPSFDLNVTDFLRTTIPISDCDFLASPFARVDQSIESAVFYAIIA